MHVKSRLKNRLLDFPLSASLMKLLKTQLDWLEKSLRGKVWELFWDFHWRCRRLVHGLTRFSRFARNASCRRCGAERPALEEQLWPPDNSDMSFNGLSNYINDSMIVKILSKYSMSFEKCYLILVSHIFGIIVVKSTPYMGSLSYAISSQRGPIHERRQCPSCVVHRSLKLVRPGVREGAALSGRICSKDHLTYND